MSFNLNYKPMTKTNRNPLLQRWATLLTKSVYVINLTKLGPINNQPKSLNNCLIGLFVDNKITGRAANKSKLIWNSIVEVNPFCHTKQTKTGNIKIYSKMTYSQNIHRNFNRISGNYENLKIFDVIQLKLGFLTQTIS